MKRLALVILFLVAAAGIGYYYYQASQANLTGVKVTGAARARIEAKVYTTGKIDPANKQEVRLFAPGAAKTVAVSVGSKVKRGDLLFELDTKEIDLQIRQAQAALDVARANESAARSRVEQIRKLAANPPQAGSEVIPGLPGIPGQAQVGLSPDMLADAQSALVQAKALVKQAQAALDLVQNQKNSARITAALDGTVLAMNVVANQPVVPQAPVVIVGDLDHLVIQAEVNEVDAAKLAVGQPVKITGVTLGEREFSGKITSVAPMAQVQPSVQGTQTTVQVIVGVDQADPALKPGFSVSLAVITAAKDNVIQVPLESVFSLSKEKYVFGLRNGIVNKVKVITGIAGDVNTEISSGLNQGDQVVINPSKDLKDGMKVRVE